MYFGGSVPTIGIGISPTPPLILQGVRKCEIWSPLKHHSYLSRQRLEMQQDIRILKQKCDATMIALCRRQVCEVGSTLPSTIIQPRIIQLCTYFVESLNAWHPTCCKSSRSAGQRSRSQRDITCAKIRKIINNSAGNCSIYLKFRTDFDHVMLDVSQPFKVNGSKVKVAAWHNVSASESAIIEARICWRSNLVKSSQSQAEHVTHCLRS